MLKFIAGTAIINHKSSARIEPTLQGFHKLFAYGYPDRGSWEIDKRSIIYCMQLILTPPPDVIFILIEISINCGNPAKLCDCLMTMLQRVADSMLTGTNVSRTCLYDLSLVETRREVGSF